MRSLGADHVIDYTTVDYTQRRASATTGSSTPTRTTRSCAVRRALSPKGVYVTLGGTAPADPRGADVGPLRRRWPAAGGSGLMLWWKPFNPRRRRDAEASSSRRARSSRSIDRRFPLSEIVDALRWVDDGHARGKVVVTMDEAPPGQPGAGRST